MYYSKPLTFNISVKFQKRPLTCHVMCMHDQSFSREEYWSKLPFPSAGDLPDPGIEPTSLESPVFLFSQYSRWWVWDTERISSLPKIHSSWQRRHLKQWQSDFRACASHHTSRKRNWHIRWANHHVWHRNFIDKNPVRNQFRVLLGSQTSKAHSYIFLPLPHSNSMISSTQISLCAQKNIKCIITDPTLTSKILVVVEKGHGRV